MLRRQESLTKHCAGSGEGTTRCAAAAGLTTEDADTPFLLEASQGDRISGKITRAEVASLVSAALNTPASVGAGPLPAPACMDAVEPPACRPRKRGSQSHARRSEALPLGPVRVVVPCPYQLTQPRPRSAAARAPRRAAASAAWAP